MAKRSAEGIVRGTSNVFADLGFEDEEERLTKLRLAQAINTIITERGLTQTSAGKLLGAGQPKVSALANYRLDGLSVERLLGFLTSLDRDVDIVIRKRSKSAGTGRILVKAA